MKSHTVEPGESLSKIAGYPDDGWEERLDHLIAANPDYPSIKNRTPDDPKYGWLEVGDVINVPIELAPVIDPGEIACPDCRDDWESIVKADQVRALDMLDATIAKLATYDGVNPAPVKDALTRRFKASSSAFATWINLNLRFLRLFAPQSEYLCRRVYYQCGGYCLTPGTYGCSPFCLPFTSIRICDPEYFGLGDRERELWLSYMSGSTSTDAILILVTATDRIVPAARRDRYSTRTLGPDSSTISADQRDVRTESASTLKPCSGRPASMFLNRLASRFSQVHFVG